MTLISSHCVVRSPLCRLSTVRNADQICVISKGKVVEQGTHSQLLALEDSQYAHLVKLQSIPGLDLVNQKPRTSSAVPHRRSSAEKLVVTARTSETVPGPGALQVAVQAADKADDEGVKLPPFQIRRLWPYAAPEAPWMVLALVSAMGNGVTFPVFSLLLSKVRRRRMGWHMHRQKSKEL